MPTIFDPFGSPQFGLSDVKVAKNNLDGSFGAAVDVPSVQLLGLQLQTTNAELTGDDIITAVHSKIIGGQATIRWGSVAFEVLEVLTNLTTESGNTTPNQYRRMRITAYQAQYFAICGKVNAVEGSGCFIMFAPLVKLMEGFTVEAQYGQFIIPNVTARFLVDTNYNNTAVEFDEYESDQTVVIPPVYT